MAHASAVSSLSWDPQGTGWAEYYEGDSYEAASFDQKREIVARLLERVAPECVWDLGANTGVFSRIAAERCRQVIAFDGDPACIERAYREARQKSEANLLPLVLDLTNPSPALGWAHEERDSLAARGSANLLLVLALIHHLAIGNNVPLSRISRFFAELAPQLLIEFVPKSDAKVQRLLASREDVFPDYTAEGFARAFGEDWETVEAVPIEGSNRILHLLRRRKDPA